MTSWLFVQVGTVVATSFTSGVASESASKLKTGFAGFANPYSVNGRFRRIQAESRFGFGKSNTAYMFRRVWPDAEVWLAWFSRAVRFAVRLVDGVGVDAHRVPDAGGDQRRRDRGHPAGARASSAD